MRREISPAKSLTPDSQWSCDQRSITTNHWAGVNRSEALCDTIRPRCSQRRFSTSRPHSGSAMHYQQNPSAWCSWAASNGYHRCHLLRRCYRMAATMTTATMRATTTATTRATMRAKARRGYTRWTVLYLSTHCQLMGAYHIHCTLHQIDGSSFCRIHYDFISALWSTAPAHLKEWDKSRKSPNARESHVDWKQPDADTLATVRQFHQIHRTRTVWTIDMEFGTPSDAASVPWTLAVRDVKTGRLVLSTTVDYDGRSLASIEAEIREHQADHGTETSNFCKQSYMRRFYGSDYMTRLSLQSSATHFALLGSTAQPMSSSHGGQQRIVSPSVARYEVRGSSSALPLSVTGAAGRMHTAIHFSNHTARPDLLGNAPPSLRCNVATYHRYFAQFTLSQGEHEDASPRQTYPSIRAHILDKLLLQKTSYVV